MKYLLSTLLLLFALLFVGCHNMDQLQNPNLIEIGEIYPQETADGTYTGKYIVGPVKVVVDVTVDDHTVTEIDIRKHRNGQGRAANAIIEDVIREQSTGVDVISGATISSKVILKAIDVALND